MTRACAAIINFACKWVCEWEFAARSGSSLYSAAVTNYEAAIQTQFSGCVKTDVLAGRYSFHVVHRTDTTGWSRVLWRATKSAGTVRPNLLRISGARKSVVAVAEDMHLFRTRAHIIALGGLP